MAPNPSLEKHPNLDEWLALDADGRVTVRTGKVDIGQHISNALALIVAEELDVDFERIDVKRAETGVSPNEGMTAGSMSMEMSGEAVRRVAATARAHILSRAADELEVDVASLDVSDGLIQSRETNHSVTYWDLFGDQPFDILVNEKITLKSPDDYRNTGKKVVAKGMREIITGEARFVHDLQPDGLLHARVVRPPHYHARLKDIDAAVVERLDQAGVQMVRDGSFVAVACEDEYLAIKSAERAGNAATWDIGGGLKEQDLFDSLVNNERVSLPVVEGTPVDAPVPPLADPPPGAVTTLQARFERPYHMHGSIGPSAAMAKFEDDVLTVWSHSQGIYPLRASLAETLNMAPDNIKLIHTPGAGCYGHNGADDVALDAALTARALPGRPVLLKWTREDEHAWEPYSSCMVMDLQASLGDDGAVLAWSHETYSDTHNNRPVPQPSMGRHVGIHRNLDPLYAFPERRLVKNLVRDLPLWTSALRTLGAYANVFAIESFMDELAEAAGVDPVQYRLQNLEDERARAVVSVAAEALHTGILEDGRGRGLGFGQYKNIQTYAAVGIELSVNDAAEVRLHRAVIAADSGQVVDPAGLSVQLEGGMLQAASWTLYEAVRFDRDGITSRDWESYPILRFDNIPEVEVILMERPGERFLGAGEASSGPTAGAIANAIKSAAGLRLRRLPFTPDEIRAAALR